MFFINLPIKQMEKYSKVKYLKGIFHFLNNTVIMRDRIRDKLDNDLNLQFLPEGNLLSQFVK